MLIKIYNILYNNESKWWFVGWRPQDSPHEGKKAKSQSQVAPPHRRSPAALYQRIRWEFDPTSRIAIHGGGTKKTEYQPYSQKIIKRVELRGKFSWSQPEGTTTRAASSKVERESDNDQLGFVCNSGTAKFRIEYACI